jgi:Skp family chaperone for outer membrane proteins
MTIIPLNALSQIELNQLGNNFEDTFQRDQEDIDAMNRSLATLGEEFDDEAISNACQSEHVAG